MNTAIEIHDHNVNITGYYQVIFTNEAGKKVGKLLSEEQINSLLDMRQKESFFIGKFRFKIKSEYNFRKMFLTIK